MRVLRRIFFRKTRLSSFAIRRRRETSRRAVEPLAEILAAAKDGVEKELRAA